MKFIHLSDLHLGKRLFQLSLLDDQKYILNQILEIIDNEKPDAVLIAGDVYDTTQPSIEAVKCLDDFLTKLSTRKINTFVISGNHDSPERLSFGSKLMQNSGVHIAPVYTGCVEPYIISDEYGEVAIYMLPFVKSAVVHSIYKDKEINSYTDAIKIAIDNMSIDNTRRNILIAHQFVTGASKSGSEELVIGGLDNVDASVFEPFDYVALGHIHSAQKIGKDSIRYSGTPLKYSFSEANDKKSVLSVELGADRQISVKNIPLEPLHDVRELKGSYEELTLKKNYESQNTEDYLHITLTDEEDIFEAMGKLRGIYKNLLKLDYDNIRTRTNIEITDTNSDVQQYSPFELFREFYKNCNGKDMTAEQSQYINNHIEQIWSE